MSSAEMTEPDPERPLRLDAPREEALEHVAKLVDINKREFLMLAMLAAAVLWMGVHPKPFTDVMQVSVSELLRHVAVSKLN